MSDFDYIAWSLLVAGGLAALLAVLSRFRANSIRSPLMRQRDRLELQLGNQLGLRHDAEAARIEGALARLDAFAANHPRIDDSLMVLENLYLVSATIMMGFLGVGLWAGKLGSGHGQWPVLFVFAPFYLIGMMIDVIPAYDSHARVKLVSLGLMVAFLVPLLIAILWRST